MRPTAIGSYNQISGWNVSGESCGKNQTFAQASRFKYRDDSLKVNRKMPGPGAY